MTSMVVLSLFSIGCAGPSQSLLEQNQPVDSGRRDFDTYFQEVDDLRDEVNKLTDSQLYTFREPLVDALDADPDIGMASLLGETQKRVAKLRDFGITLDLQLMPTPKVLVDRGEMGSDDDKGLPEAIQESASRAMAFFDQHQKLLEKAENLEKKRGEVAERINRMSPDDDKRGYIETEIVGAGRVLDGSEKRLLGNTRTISHFLVGLVQVSDTGARQSLDDKCERAVAQFDEDEKKKADKSKLRGKRPVARPQQPAARPTPRPVPVARPTPPPPARPAPRPPTRAAGGDFEM